MAVKLQFRRDTAANWETNNPILSEGELGLDTTNQRFKIGDGVNTWDNIDFSQYTNKAETFSDNITLLGSETTDPAGTDWAEETTGTWEGFFKATKSINGLLVTDNPLIDLDLSQANSGNTISLQGDYANIVRVVVENINTITLYAFQEPILDVPILIKVVR
jgi:hypothetical protein